MVSPHFHVTFYPSLITINGCGGNLVPPSYFQVMCGFIKGKRSLFMHYEQHDPSSTFISPSDKVHTTSENAPEP